MSMTSFEPASAATAADDWTPQDVAAHKRYCTWLQYWRDCAAPACRRAHACAGDPTACFLGRWIHLSEAAKVWVGAGIKALDMGLSARNAAGAADLALLRHIKLAARLPRHPPRRKRWRSIRPHGEEPCAARRLEPCGRPLLRDGRVPRPPQDEGG